VAISAVEDAVDAAHNGVDRRLVLRGERRPARPVLTAQAGPPSAEIIAAAGPGGA
jgi:hypothetical protein